MTRNQVNLTQPGAYAELQRIAARLGYLQTHGPRAGEGSVSKMLEAIARGELRIEKTELIVAQSIAPADSAGASEGPNT